MPGAWATRAALTLLGAAAFLGLSLAGAAADNVPGVPGSVAQDLAEEAAGMLVDGISDAVALPGADGCGGVGPSPAGGGVAAQVRQRAIRTDALDYDLVTGFVLGGHCFDARTLAFAGLVFESGSGDLGTDGTGLRHDGVGLAAGLGRALSDRAAVAALAGHMWLDYEATFPDGADRASFGAERSFLDLSGRLRLEAPDATSVVHGGLRYVIQTNDAHRDGGVPVPASRRETLSAVLGARTTFAARAGGLAPFVEGDLRRDLSSRGDGPAGLGADDGSATHGRIGVGAGGRSGGTTFESGLGASFDEDGYTGLDAYLRLTLRF